MESGYLFHSHNYNVIAYLVNHLSLIKLVESSRMSAHLVNDTIFLDFDTATIRGILLTEHFHPHIIHLV